MTGGREKFASQTAVVMALAGSAIGLGNIWRFPYMVGRYGGAAFIVVYILCVALLSLPLMLSESIIGRSTQSNTFGAVKKLAPGSGWKWLSLLTILTPLVILSYYSVVGGWSLGFLCESVAEGFDTAAPARFGQFVSATWGPLACFTLFLIITAVIVKAGVKSGIEKFNRISLPVLFVLIVAIAIYSMLIPGSKAGLDYLLKPDFGAINARTVAFAMGQGFFSLSLGVGTVLTYSSYMKKEDNLLQTGVGTAFFDILFALIAGMAIMPAVFSAGIEPGAGPSLIFETLPYIFAKMGASAPLLSRIVSILFFLTIVVAALTSSISMLEVGTAYMVEEKKMSRRKAVWILSACVWMLGALCCLSFGALSGVKIGGQNIFSFLDMFTSNYLITFGAFLFVIFAGWKIKPETLYDEFTNCGTIGFNVRVFKSFRFFLKFIAPPGVLAIFLCQIFLSQ